MLPDDEVICPACAHHFHAISQADQRLRTLLSSSRGEQGWRNALDELLGACQRYDADPCSTLAIADYLEAKDHAAEVLAAASSAPGPVPTSLAQGQLHWVACERCGGSGEVEVRPSVGPYDDPTTCAEICSACDGTGRFCEETHPAERDDDLAVPTSLAGQGTDVEALIVAAYVRGAEWAQQNGGLCDASIMPFSRKAARDYADKTLSAAPQPTAGGVDLGVKLCPHCDGAGTFEDRASGGEIECTWCGGTGDHREPTAGGDAS